MGAFSPSVTLRATVQLLGVLRSISYGMCSLWHTGILFCYGVKVLYANCIRKILSFSKIFLRKINNKKSLFISYFLFVDNLTHVV